MAPSAGMLTALVLVLVVVVVGTVQGQGQSAREGGTERKSPWHFVSSLVSQTDEIDRLLRVEPTCRCRPWLCIRRRLGLLRRTASLRQRCLTLLSEVSVSLYPGAHATPG